MNRVASYMCATAAVMSLIFASSFLNAQNGTHATSTVLSSTGVQGNYTFNATITAYGKPNPTGSIVFTDTTTGATLGTVPVNNSNTVGGFSKTLTLPSNYNPDGAVAADVNGDGIPDIIVALANPYASAPPGAPANNNPGCGFCPGTQNIQVYLGNGDGTFQNPSYYPAGFDPSHIVVADVNGDGYPDLIVTDYDEVYGGTETSGGAYPVNEGYYEAGVYLNMGKGAPGTFAPAVYFKTGTNPWTAVVGDFNGDGFPDIVVDNSGDNTLEFFPGNGTGTFSAMSSIVATNVSFENNHSFAAADVNGDGILDLIGVNYGTGNVQVLLGQGSGEKGNGTFAAPANYAASTGNLSSVNPVGVAVADVNGDGIPDIVSNNRGVGNAGVLIGNGDGTFKPVVTYAIGDSGSSYANGIAIADMNGDGNPDIVTVDNGSSYDIGILYGNGDGTFQARAGVAVGPGGGTPLVADFNQDGRLDLGTENFTPNSTTTLLGYASETVALTGITLPGSTTDNVTATYSGDSTYSPSTSNSLNLKSGGLLEPTIAVPATVTAGTPFSFSVTENNRSGTVAANYTGTLTFTSSDPLAVLPAPSTLPNGQGTFTATLYSDGPQSITVTDLVNGLNTTSSNVTVSGGGVAFVSSPGSPTSITTNFGSTVTYTFTATPLLNLFNAPVTFAVSGLPSNSYTSSFSPATIAAGTSGAQTVTLTIQVPGAEVATQAPYLRSNALAMMAFLAPLFGFRVARKAKIRWSRSLFLLAIGLSGLIGAAGLSACNSNNNAYESPQVFPLTVTATSGSSSPTAGVTLIVGTNNK